MSWDGPPGAEADYVYSGGDHAPPPLHPRSHEARRARPPRRRRSSSSDDSAQRDSRHRRRRTPPPRRRSAASSSSGDTPPPRRRAAPRARERSLTPPRSYQPRERSPSSASPSSASASPSRSASRSPARRVSADSDTSSRGRFSGYDRKRYFRKLKEQQAKEQQQRGGGAGAGAEPAPSAPPGAVRPGGEDVAALQYGDPPPLEGVNFEDLPPPPQELCVRAGSTRRPPPAQVTIRNDGSFLEMFKRMQEECGASATAAQPVCKKPVLPLIGKRRGGRVLKTGIVKKTRAVPESPDAAPKDAWSLYMQEVKKYRETSCEEERKTRPLVK